MTLIAGIGVLYGSYLIYRGKTSILFGWGKTRLEALINLAIGVLTLLTPGGVAGPASILAIVSGTLGFLSACLVTELTEGERHPSVFRSS